LSANALAKNGSFDFACALDCVRGQKQMCQMRVGLRILKFLRAGKVPVENREFSCHDKAFKEAGICTVIHSRNSVYLHFRHAHNSFIATILLN